MYILHMYVFKKYIFETIKHIDSPALTQRR